MDKDQKNYIVKVAIYTVSDKGQDKVEKVQSLIEGAKDAKHAYDEAYKAYAVSGMLSFDIVSVVESNIAEVLVVQ